MKDIVGNRNHRMYLLVQSQDHISRQRFMEVIISTDITYIQKSYLALSRYHLSIEQWTTGLITKLMEVTHGQWLYRNVLVHYLISGTTETLRKENIQMEIEKQQELSTESLEEGDKYLTEINLEDTENTSVKRQQYCLLEIRAAREAIKLRAHHKTPPPTGTSHRREFNSITQQQLILSSTGI